MVLDIADGDLRIRSVRRAVQRAQSLVQRFVRQGRNLADELIEERRETARLE